MELLKEEKKLLEIYLERNPSYIGFKNDLIKQIVTSRKNSDKSENEHKIQLRKRIKQLKNNG